MSIAIFASGNGSNFQAIVQQSRQENWPQQVSLLLCDRPEANVVERAKELGIHAVSFVPKTFASKADYEQAVLAVLQTDKIAWIVLAGYMRLIGPTLLEAYPGRIINIHPSLLPAFPGKNGLEEAFYYPVKVSGVTVHFVDAGIDTGPIIAQMPVSISATDSLETFAAKMHQAEHQLYPKVILALITGKSEVPGANRIGGDRIVSNSSCAN
jgi:phosphoribosylglycinamide formyltransferase 1